ncbi:hypothetical protein AB0G74_00400 [Streptomyces sp. NPDC020875]|uniref:hypothetical protein n=1 Tax=Streptomyces sp. NPDC020875 TaxID=3154898 RepID=UPI0033E51B1A
MPRVVTAAALAVATLAATALAAVPASAQEVRPTASWQRWTSTIGPEDNCTSTAEPVSGVYFQVCALRTSDRRAAQAALIVINRRGAAVDVAASVRLIGYPSSASCPRSRLNPDIRVVCFSPTVPISGAVRAEGSLSVWL